VQLGGKEPRWINRLVVEAVQFDLIRTFGGMPGLRDEPGLESALARPRQRFAYEPSSDLAPLAAAYGHSLLGLNGQEIDAPETEVVAVMLNLAAGELTEEHLADWIRSRLADGRR
jgi:death-on-curing protein